METTLIIVLATALIAATVILFNRRHNKPDSQILLIQQQLDAIRNQLRESLEGSTQTINKQMNDTREAMDKRLDNAARVIGDMQKSMGHVHEALAPVSELRDILKAPKLRGGFGEVLLENLLSEMIPANMFTLQHGFADGERVDAAIKIGGQLVPIDSKFPLEKYREFNSAVNDDERKVARKSIVSAIKKHMTDVAKYIRPDEGTYPFAFMYIPSESIYYELFVGREAEDALWNHASSLRVFPVSSNTIYIYLQTISFGLKGMQIAEHARELLNKLEQLQKSFGDIRKNYEKIGTHLKNAQSAYDDTDKKLDKFETKFSAISTETAPELAEPSSEKPVELIQ